MPYDLLDPASATVLPSLTAAAPLSGTVRRTYSQLQAAVGRRLGDRNDVNLDLPEWVNEAYLDLATSTVQEEMRTSLAFDLEIGQALYLLPEEVMAMGGASLVATDLLAGGIPLIKSSVERYRKREVASEVPTEFFRYGRLLVFWPTPSSVRTVVFDNVRFRPRPLIADDDQSILGYEWDRGIILKARVIGFSSIGQVTEAALAENEYTRFVRQRFDPTALETEGRHMGVSVPRTRRELHGYVRREEDAI